jgi:O-antigen/teichoic acid export membrane protein
MTDSLRKKAERGAIWSFIDAAGNRIIQFVIGIILARLLMPEQFGLLGMLAIFMAVAQTFLDSGFGVALIQKKEVTQADTSSVFYFNVVVGIVMAGLLCLAAPWIASFYRQPILLPLTRAMSLLLAINSLAVVQTAMLSRNVAFKLQAKISLISSLCSGSLGVVMAYRGYGVWSLVAQQLTRAVLNVGLLWGLNRWRPGLVFSFRALRQMFVFGSRMLASGLLNQVFTNIYDVLIGRLFSATDLGFYIRAKHLEELPSATLTNIVTRVSLPVFSSIQDDKTRLTNGLRRMLSLLVFVNVPIMMLLATAASSLVEVLLTEKWLPCVGYMRLLCIHGMLLPLHALNLNVLTARGRSDLFLRLEVLKKGLTICNILVTWRWGIMAIIIGQVVLGFVDYFLNSYYSGKLLGYPARQQLRDIGGYFLSAAVAGAGVYALQYVGFPNAMLLLAAQVVFGLTAYLLLCRLFRLPALADGWRLVVERVPGLARFRT